MSKRAKTPARVNPETGKTVYGGQGTAIQTTGNYFTRTDLEAALWQDWLEPSKKPSSWRALGIRHGVSGSTARNIIIRKMKE